jgi:two-component system response regulator AlgR
MSSEQQRFSVLVADDEPLARERLAQMLQGMRHEVPIGEILLASDGMEAFEMLSAQEEGKNATSIVFLDIRMPRMDGLELAHHLGKMRRPPLIVFVTAHDEYAVSAFEAHALDYILKPARKERIKEAFAKLERLGMARERVGDSALVQAGLDGRTHLSVSERGKVRLIPVDDILFLKAELKYTTIKTIDKEYLTEEPLIGLEEEFGERFVRIHRNCLIPKAKLRGFERNRSEESGWVAVVDGIVEKLPVSRRQWAQIRELKLF